MENAETEIRLLIKTEFFKSTPYYRLTRRVDEIINAALKDVTIPNLRAAAIKSLRNFAQRQYNEYARSFTGTAIIISALAKLTDKAASDAVKREARKTLIARGSKVLARYGYSSANLYGVALQKFTDDYMRDNVTPVLRRLEAQFPKNPDDITGHNSLRNLAEMEVRYASNRKSIADLKAAGVRLVIASTHADCSKRCRPYQGRVYSLDGTSGVTDDGREFVPLEEATEIPYTTKAGKTYMNGLLGFNCRHFLIPYKTGYRFPRPNPAEERRQYAITERQRAYEREIRKWRTKAILNYKLNRKEYAFAKAQAEEWNARYIAFSKKHRRAYYPSRTKILEALK